MLATGGGGYHVDNTVAEDGRLPGKPCAGRVLEVIFPLAWAGLCFRVWNGQEWSQRPRFADE